MGSAGGVEGCFSCHRASEEPTAARLGSRVAGVGAVHSSASAPPVSSSSTAASFRPGPATSATRSSTPVYARSVFALPLIFGVSRKVSMAARTVGPPALVVSRRRGFSLVTVAATAGPFRIGLPDNARESRFRQPSVPAGRRLPIPISLPDNGLLSGGWPAQGPVAVGIHPGQIGVDVDGVGAVQGHVLVLRGRHVAQNLLPEVLPAGA